MAPMKMTEQQIHREKWEKCIDKCRKKLRKTKKNDPKLLVIDT